MKFAGSHKHFIKERREAAFLLNIQGMKPQEIALELKTSLRTIQYDLRAFGEERAAKADRHMIDDLEELDTIVTILKEMRREAFLDFRALCIPTLLNNNKLTPDLADHRINLFQVRLEIEDAITEALQKHNVVYSREAVKRLKDKTAAIRNKLDMTTTTRQEEEEKTDSGGSGGDINNNNDNRVQEESQIV